MTDKDGVAGDPGSSSQDADFARKGMSDDATGVDSTSILQQHGASAKPVDGRESSDLETGFTDTRVASGQGTPAPMLDEPAANAGIVESDGKRHKGDGADGAASTQRVAASNPSADTGASKHKNAGAAVPAGAAAKGHPGQHAGGRHHRHHVPAKAPNGKAATKYAALDLGTNNCRLLIAEPKDQGFRIIDSFSRIVRLGEGISINNRLGDDASDRAISALRVCWNKLKYHKVENVRLIATEACRSAENGTEFLQRVTREIGLELEIIDRETEARLAVTGCSSLVEPRSDGVVLFDIGGGSSEIVWMDRRGRRKRNRLGGTLRAWDSLPVGVVTLSERHDGKNVTRDSFEVMVNEVREMLAVFPERRELHQALSRGRHHLLGTSGTVTTLAGVHLGLRRYDRRRVDGMWMSNKDAGSMIDKLLALSYDQRVGHPCIGSDRADLVLPGCAIFEAIRREFPCDQLRIADRGLREGILVELMNKDGHGLSRRKNRSTPWRRKRPRSKAGQQARENANTGGTSHE